MNSGPGNQSSRIYVGGLTLSVTQKDIDDLFNKFGQILEIRMNRTFAFVQFQSDTEAQAAIRELNGTNHFGRRLDVQIARHPKAGGGGGGPNKGDDMPSRDGRDRSPIGRGPGGGGRDGMGGGRDGMGGGRDGMGGGRDGMGGGGGRGGMGGGGRGSFGGGGRGGGMYNSGGRGGDDSPFGGRGPAGGDFRGGPDYRGGGGDFPPSRQEGGFGGRSSDGGLFGERGGGRDFSLAPPTGFRDGGGASKFWGGGGSGLNEKAFDSRGRGGNDLGPPPRSYNQELPPTHPIEPISVPNNERTNDIEIIIVDKSLTEYGEMIERKMSCLGFSVDVLFPHEAVPLARVLANIASRGTLYAVVITHVHQINGSLTLHILHGRPQEHRNMAIDDAITLLLRNYETYTRACRDKGGPNSPPEQVRHLMTQALNGRPLTGTQYDILVQYLLQEKLKLEPSTNPDNQNSTAQQAELQTRILSILNKTSTGGGGGEPVAHQPAPVLPTHGPLLQDPSIQKALDNLIQGGDILRKIAPQQPFGRF